MQIEEATQEKIPGEEIGTFDFATQVDRELLRGKGKPDLHPLVRAKVMENLANRIPDISHVIFHVDGIEKGSRPSVRICVTAFQAS